LGDPDGAGIFEGGAGGDEDPDDETASKPFVPADASVPVPTPDPDAVDEVPVGCDVLVVVSVDDVLVAVVSVDDELLLVSVDDELLPVSVVSVDDELLPVSVDDTEVAVALSVVDVAAADDVGVPEAGDGAAPGLGAKLHKIVVNVNCVHAVPAGHNISLYASLSHT